MHAWCKNLVLNIGDHIPRNSDDHGNVGPISVIGDIK